MKLKRCVKTVFALILSAGIISGCGNTSSETTATATQNEAVTSEIANAEASDSQEALDSGSEVVILYTNDVHSYINNSKKNGNEEEVRGISYATVAKYKNDLIESGKNVLLVDAGDHVQGTAYGGMNEGDSIIDIMNATGYQLATLGNHEFDYGQFKVFELMDAADYPYVSCNFYSTQTNETVLPAYEVLEAGGVKIAFVGISTPETITKSSPVYFEDSEGNRIYDFYSGEDGQELYDAVQKAIDAAKSEADYVIALGHVGIDPGSAPYRSTDIIANTSGLSAFIDGHSHSTVPMDIIKDKEGKDVVLTQTGSAFSAFGQMTIASDGTIKTELISEYEGREEQTEEIEENWIAEVDRLLGEQIGILDSTLYVNDANDPATRLIRRRETNLGDFVADAGYYYYNIEKQMPCDVVIINGGGIKTDLPDGDLTYLSAKTVNPYGNPYCLIKTKGQNILDALEHGCRLVGEKDEVTGELAEGGTFLHVAGLTYEFDETVKSTEQVDDDGIFVAAPTGEYKVRNVQIFNREKGEYEPLDTEKEYYVASYNYLLRNHGGGLTMFDDSELVADYDELDYLIIADYIAAFKTNSDGMPEVNTANSPLGVYEGYKIDYENPYGAGRITVIVQ